MFGLSGNNQNSNTLNLGVPSQQPIQTANPWAQQQQPNPFMAGLFGGQQQANQFMQQPMQPPSEIEIQMELLKQQATIERFVASSQMGVLIEMMGSVVTLSVLEILRNATFTLNEDDGTLRLDTTTLPANLQTMSAENIASQFTNLQASAQQVVNQSEMTQQQLAALAQQSMMGGALAALQSEGVMEKVGGGVGSFARSMLTGGR
jgi:flagellar capping protein FliD|tara:strand:- start:384 stop:998 length:615 start_codon:yes stop_codon:yes gene_type:complete